MKKQILLLASAFLFQFSFGQILCVECYQQNDSVFATNTNLLQNGGFENGCPNNDYFCPASNNYFGCNLTGWTCTGGGTLTYAQIATTTSGWTNLVQGNRAAYFGNTFCQACSTTANDTTCVANTSCEVSGIPAGYPNNTTVGYGGTAGVNLEQTVTGLTVGNTYILEFWAGGEYSTGTMYRGMFAVDIGFGKTYLRNKPTAHGTGIGTRYVIAFTATSTAHTIRFTNWGHIAFSCTELVLDDVKLYPWTSIAPPCSGTVSANDLSENEELIIYPNPATDELGITNYELGIKEVAIYNVLGKCIQQLTTNNQQPTLNISSLDKGIYFIELKSKEGIRRKKFVKQ